MGMGMGILIMHEYIHMYQLMDSPFYYVASFSLLVFSPPLPPSAVHRHALKPPGNNNTRKITPFRVNKPHTVHTAVIALPQLKLSLYS